MSEFVTNLLAVLGSLLTLVLTLLKSDLGKMIVQRVKGEAAQRALLTLSDTAFAIVSKYQQTAIAGLKNDAKDGKITRDELKAGLQKIKAQAQGELADLSKGGLSHCLDLLGVDASQAPQFLDTLLESAIHKLRNGSTSGVELPTTGAPSSTWASLDRTLPPTEPKAA